MSSQKATSDRKLRKKNEIEEAAILNFQTTTVCDFQIATRSPILTQSLKNISKVVLKRLVYIIFRIVRGIKTNSGYKTFR